MILSVLKIKEFRTGRESGREASIKVFLNEKYPEFWRDIQGLRPFFYMRERIIVFDCFAGFGWDLLCAKAPSLLFQFAAYTTMFIRDNLNDDGSGSLVFGFRLGGRNYEFPLTTLANVWGLKNEGVTFKGGNNSHGTWNEFNKLDAIRGLWLEHATPGKYAGKEKQIHWPYLTVNRMLRYLQGKPTSFLAHAHLWSRIFEIAPLDLTREKDVEPEISHAISSKNINQMRRNLVDHVGVAENARVDAMEDAQHQVETDAPAQIPTETGVPPQFQPDIAEFVRKGFEDMRSMMTEGFARLSDRIDRLDTHMTRIEQRHDSTF
ncbi:hypothetical protein PIB30_076806 [Stylosanthes scabra]|uniref:Uncharacterized protein n=1 Tax=Stylosanthes scabra TaxID=79078 RepID=A0ABU6UP62_9FABA|nr:hypothetical protein [Stylosanthes scabra]